MSTGGPGGVGSGSGSGYGGQDPMNDPKTVQSYFKFFEKLVDEMGESVGFSTKKIPEDEEE
jgi:hypothetical protein